MSSIKKFVCECGRETVIRVMPCPNMLCRGSDHVNVQNANLVESLTPEQAEKLSRVLSMEFGPENVIHLEDQHVWFSFYIRAKTNSTAKNLLDLLLESETKIQDRRETR